MCTQIMDHLLLAKMVGRGVSFWREKNAFTRFMIPSLLQDSLQLMFTFVLSLLCRQIIVSKYELRKKKIKCNIIILQKISQSFAKERMFEVKIEDDYNCWGKVMYVDMYLQ
jgi:hypothetical protein